MRLVQILVLALVSQLCIGCAMFEGWSGPMNPDAQPEADVQPVYHDAVVDVVEPDPFPPRDIEIEPLMEVEAPPAAIEPVAPPPAPAPVPVVVEPVPVAVSAPAPAPAPAPVADRTYTVCKGDTLQKISEQFFGTTRRWPDIFWANQDTLKSPDVIRVGQVLKIPPAK